MESVTDRGCYPVGSGFGVMWDRRVRIDDPDLEVLVELELRVKGGRLAVSRFMAEERPGGSPVSAETFRAIPLVRLISRAADGGLLSGGLVKLEAKVNGSTTVRPVDLEALPEAERVAVVYRAAYFLGLAPTSTVAEVLGISRDAAAKRVQAARWAGLLEPTSKGKKGA